MTNQFTGIAASAGYAIGEAYILQNQEIKVIKKKLSEAQKPAELARLEQEISTAKQEIEELRLLTSQKIGDVEAEIFDAHIMLLEDPEYLSGIRDKINVEAYNAEWAVEEVTEQFLAIFTSLDDEYIRERAADLKDVSQRLLRRLMGISQVKLSELSGKKVVIARELTPSDTTQLNRDVIIGIVTSIGGRTSHSAIMARSLEIPAVVGVQSVLDFVTANDIVIVDGIEGKVIINPSEEVLKDYEKKQEEFAAKQSALQDFVHKPSFTKDGVQVELAANIGSPEDAHNAVKNGAEGIGLYRTEFLYMGRKNLPTEEEQFLAYKEVAEIFGKHPVVIRTLDIGGDKELDYLDLPKEMNPFLGYRAIRLCLDRVDLFKTQLRAILRASVYGNIKIMYPMIATLEELRAANALLSEVKGELRSANIPFNQELEIGMMIEIPSAAVMADMFAKEVDFFSIGTNDLVQYTMAADRMNERVSYLYQPFNPAVLRLIQGVIAAAHKENKWAGMCGEMAGDAAAIPVLLGMGLDEFSMSASSIPAARKLLSALSRKELEDIAREVLLMSDAKEIRQYIEQKVAVHL